MQTSGEFELNATETRKTAGADLRIALAMRGGVSLAVWIGGAVCEVEALRSAEPESIYGQLLRLSNYQHVDVDIMTGASAGGLNGAIYSASLMYGFHFGEMEEIWLELADVESLARSTRVRRGEPERPSLFEGEGYFRAKFVEKLRLLVESGPKPHKAPPRLDLFLTATRLEPIARIFRDAADNRLIESRSAAFFHFHHLGERGGPLSDFADTPASLTSTVPELALAGRSTSSFPVAFEPASVFTAPPGSSMLGPGPNMFGKFSEQGETQVIDGGVLDNIPVGRAIQAIAGAPASGPAERWLLYLNPSPAEPQEAVADGNLNAILRSLKRAALLKFNTESLSDDLAALSTHNSSMTERRAARASLLLSPTPDPTAALVQARAAWAATDAQRIVEVLADPDLAFASHPFTRFASPPPIEDEWDDVADDRRCFQDTLASATRLSYEEVDVSNPPLLALGDVVDTLLTIAQQVNPTEPADSLGAEATLYRVRLIVEVLTAVWEQRWVRAAGSRNGAPVEPWTIETAVGLRRDGEQISPAILDTIEGVDEAAFHAAVADLYRSAIDRDGTNTVGLHPLWDIVAEEATTLLSGPLPSDPIVDGLAAILDGSTAGPDGSGGGIRFVAVMTASLHRRQLAGESPIRLMRIAGNASTPLNEWFGLSETPSTKDKLAGAQVANFGAFFSAKWRGNDWMWGRLDSAQGLVDLLTDSSRWFGSAELQPAQLLGILEGLVTAGVEDDWARYFTDQWNDAAVEIEAELRAAHEEPTRAHSLVVTRRLLLMRIHAELVRTTLPRISELGEAPPEPPSEPQSSLSLKETMDRAKTLGRLSKKVPQDLDRNRWATIGMRTGLNAWLALRPKKLVPRSILTVMKPMFVFLLGCLVLPRRALLAGIVGLIPLTLGRWGVPQGDRWVRPEHLWSGPLTVGAGALPYWSAQRIFAAIILGLLGTLFFWMCVPKPKRTAWKHDPLSLAMTALPVVALAFAVVGQQTIHPLSVLVAAALVIVVGVTPWVRRGCLPAVFLMVAVSYGVWMVGYELFDRLSVGWWVVGAFPTAFFAFTAFVTYTDPLPPRPGRAE